MMKGNRQTAHRGNLQDFYHITPIREGILCWYPFERNASVLDLSGGVLGELLEKRCGHIDHPGAAKEERSDYIVVLDPADFTVEGLMELRAKLKPDGRLLLAYENPFALRYWAGKASPNTGLPYDTLFGRGTAPLPSRPELLNRLKAAGFEGQKWYYPLTDHWFAWEVYSENYLPNEYLSQRFTPYMADGEFLQFDERELYYEVIRGGAFEFMCGAYLVEARCDSALPPCPVDYAAVTAYREPANRFATTVRNDGTVHKTPLHADGLESVRRIHQNHQDLASLGVDIVGTCIVDDSLIMPRLNLPTLCDYWVGKISRGVFDENEMIAQFDRIRDSIMKASANGRCYWELVPANCFFDGKDDRIIFFDQEFYWENASPDIALARAIAAIRFASRVLRDDPRAEHWLAVLLDRYKLTEQWNSLFATFVLNANMEIFGHGAAGLETETAKAVSSIAANSFLRRHHEKMSHVAGVLMEMGYHRPIIYGMGKRGQALDNVLTNAGTTIAATVDRKNKAFSSVEQIPPGIDADVLIVSIRGGQPIADELRSRTALPVFTLEELIDERSAGDST